MAPTTQQPYSPPLVTRARIVSMAVTSTGFVRWKSNPASRDCRLLSSLPQPVRATSTAPLSDGSARNRLATSYPFIPGSPMSRNTTSGLNGRAASRASGPL